MWRYNEDIYQKVDIIDIGGGFSTDAPFKLSDIYSGQVLPEHLLIAHEDLDEALLGIFGLPLEANSAEILEVLVKKFADLSR